MQKTQGITGGQRMGFLSADHVVWDRRYASGRCGRRPQCAKRGNDSHLGKIIRGTRID